MICEKCGTQFSEGRNCPNCNALAIYVNEDDYKSRQQEWEAENAPKEENTKQKRKLNIHIDPVIIKKIGIVVAVVCVIATAIIWITGRVKNAIHQGQYRLIYDNGTLIDSGERSFDVYSAEDAIFSTSGNFIYHNDFTQYQYNGEITDKYISPKGNATAIVTISGTEDAVYSLYYADKTDSVLVCEGPQAIKVIEVTDDGCIYFEKSEMGAYEIVLATSVYRYDGEKTTLIADNVTRSTPCENQHEFIYYDKDMLVYLYCNGESKILGEENGNEYICTGTGKIYYLTLDGTLYEDGKIASIDRNIVAGSLMPVANSDKVVYSRDGMLFAYGGSFKSPVKLLDDYNTFDGKCNVVEKNGKVYYAYDNVLYTCSKNGRKITTKDGVKAVYLNFK